MTEHAGEEQTLRERVAEAIERGIRQQEEGWDACATCLGRVADVVLADLGLEQVGWRIPDAAGEDGGIIHDESDVPHIHHDECEPVYRITPYSGREGTR